MRYKIPCSPHKASNFYLHPWSGLNAAEQSHLSTTHSGRRWLATNQSLLTKSAEFLNLSFTWWDSVGSVGTRVSLSLIWVLIVQCKYVLCSPTGFPPPSLAQEIWVLSLMLLGMDFNKHLQVQVWPGLVFEWFWKFPEKIFWKDFIEIFFVHHL